MTDVPNWDRRLNAARRRGIFNREDDELSSSFDTCAVAEAGGYRHYGKVDKELCWMGLDFTGLVNEGQPYNIKARKLYTRILKRGAKVAMQ